MTPAANNLLAIVIGFSDLAAQSLGEKDPIRDYISQIRGAGDRASALTVSSWRSAASRCSSRAC